MHNKREIYNVRKKHGSLFRTLFLFTSFLQAQTKLMRAKLSIVSRENTSVICQPGN